jgi:lipopolysaccharide transport system permease protein
MSAEHLLGFVVVNLLTLGLLFAVWGVFRLAMPILIERMSA